MTAETCSLSPEIQKKLVDGLLELFGDNIDQIILYGSVARGDDGPESDVDVAVIVKRRFDAESVYELASLCADLDLEYDKVFSLIDIYKADFESKKDILFYYRNIVKDGVVLWKAA